MWRETNQSKEEEVAKIIFSVLMVFSYRTRWWCKNVVRVYVRTFLVSSFRHAQRLCNNHCVQTLITVERTRIKAGVEAVAPTNDCVHSHWHRRNWITECAVTGYVYNLGDSDVASTDRHWSSVIKRLCKQANRFCKEKDYECASLDHNMRGARHWDWSGVRVQTFS